jgi:large subunit ribosomal protein L14
MLIPGSRVQVTDNTGAKEVEVITVKGGFASIGDIFTGSVKKTIGQSKVAKGQVIKAVVVETKKEFRRKDGSTIKFDRNACVIVNNKGQPIGTRVLGFVTHELRSRQLMKVLALAARVL